MPDAEKRQRWLEEIRDPTARILAISSVVALVFVIVFLHSEVRVFLSRLQWWQELLVAFAAIALPILASRELLHSKEANTLRREANDLRAEENRLQERIGELTAEHNAHLQKIAKNTQQPITPAERNAAMLHNHLGANVSVSEGINNHWGNTPEIAEVREGNIVTLFTPRSTASTAWCVDVYCGELEISEIPLGSCPLRLKIIKRHGSDVQLGEITKWAERELPAAGPAFRKGNRTFDAEYTKQGVAERRRIYVYISSDGTNMFLLEASTGESPIGNNVEISKRFWSLETDYRAAGFNRAGSGSNAGAHPVFMQ